MRISLQTFGFKMIKKSLVYALLFVLLATAAFAAVSSGDFSSPDHPGKCVIREDFIVGTGTHQADDGCARIICHGGHAEIQSCGSDSAGPGCKLGNIKSPDADYPECCHHEIICE